MASAYDRALKRHAAGRLADLGCGTAPLYCVYRRLVSGVTCLDWASSFHRSPYVDIAHDLNEPLPLPDADYDTVLLSDVLEHIYEPSSLLSESARILKPGGALIIGVPFMYWIHEAPHDYYRFTEHCLRRMLADCDFEIVQFERVGGIFDVVADLNLKVIAGISESLSRALSRLALAFTRSRIGERIRHRTGVVTPLGYVIVARKGPVESISH